MVRAPVLGLGEEPSETETFCLNRYKIQSIHVRKLNELDSTQTDSIMSIIKRQV